MSSMDQKNASVPRATVDEETSSAEAPVKAAGRTVAGGVVKSAIGGVKAAFASVKAGASTAFGGFMGAMGAVGSFVGVTTTTAAVGTTTVALAAVLTGGAIVADEMRFNPAVLDEAYADCTTQVAEVRKSLGSGTNVIPETSSGGLATGYLTTWENTGEWMKTYINRNSAQWAIVEAWDQHGRTDENGFERIGDYYIAAVQASVAFGPNETTPAAVGDWITFYFEDGESFDIIVGDTKGNPDMFADGNLDRIVSGADGFGNGFRVNGYGHIQSDGKGGEGVNCVEFWGLATERNGFNYDHFGMMGHHGQRVASCTNHGPSEYAPGSDVARSTVAKARTSAIADVLSNCTKAEASGSYDNSDLVNALLSYAYANCQNENSFIGGTKLYQKVFHAIWGNDGYMCSCDRGVATAVRWSGTDEEFPIGDCSNQYTYCTTSPKWEDLGDMYANKDKLQPGDVCIVGGGHTQCFVGEEAIANHTFEEGGTPQPGYNTVQASYGDFSPCASFLTEDGRAFHIFRCVKPDNGTKYADVAKE